MQAVLATSAVQVLGVVDWPGRPWAMATITAVKMSVHKVTASFQRFFMPAAATHGKEAAPTLFFVFGFCWFKPTAGFSRLRPTRSTWPWGSRVA